jgi:uncharacterized protein (TIGR03435 family)
MVENATLRFLILTAYGFLDYQLSGGPAWISSERYDIEAKMDGAIAWQTMGPMLQVLLEDRSRLIVHHQARQLPAYELVRKIGLCITPLL